MICTTTSSSWRRVSRREHCPICDKPDWCLVAGPSGALTAAICARIESHRPAGSAGWVHNLADDGWRAKRHRTVTLRVPASRAQSLDMAKLAAGYFAAVRTPYVTHFADGLRLSLRSLQRLRVGWAADKQ